MAYVKVCVFCRTESDIKKLITPYLGQQEAGSSKLWDSYTSQRASSSGGSR